MNSTILATCEIMNLEIWQIYTLPNRESAKSANPKNPLGNLAKIYNLAICNIARMM